MNRISYALALCTLSGLSAAQTSAPLRTRPRVECPGTPVGDVAFDRYVSLVGMTGCSASNAAPWSIALAPGGESYFVTLFGGGIGAPNCQVAEFSSTTHDLLRTIAVGASPEEIAFTRDARGNLRHGFVTNSSSSSVSVFDARRDVVATIPLPFDDSTLYDTAFPFGIAVSPDQTRVFVGTLDNTGRIFAIDTERLALVPAEQIELGPGHNSGRMLFAGDELIAPVTLSHAGFQGSTAKVAFIRPEDGSVSMLTLASSSTPSAFPAAEDVALVCETKLFVAGFDLGAKVYVLDTVSRSVVNTIRTHTSQPQGKFQALGVSPSGLVAVADFWSSEIAFIDGWTETWVRTQPPGALPNLTQPNELVFDARGDTLLVPSHTSDLVAVFAAN